MRVAVSVLFFLFALALLAICTGCEDDRRRMSPGVDPYEDETDGGTDESDAGEGEGLDPHQYPPQIPDALWDGLYSMCTTASEIWPMGMVEDGCTPRNPWCLHYFDQQFCTRYCPSDGFCPWGSVCMPPSTRTQVYLDANRNELRPDPSNRCLPANWILY